MTSTPLSDALVAAVPRELHEAATPALEANLRTVLDAARKAWTEVAPIDDAYFMTYVGARLTPPGPLDAVLAKRKTADLYLACACTLRDPNAVAIVEKTYVPSLRASLAKIGIRPAQIEDTKQIVLERLLVTGEESTPKIAEYDATGELRSWLRVVVVREAVHLAKKGNREVELSDALLDMPVTGDDPEMAYLKAHYRTEYRQAFADAVAELTPKQRLMLRQQFLQGLTIDQIGAIHQVHRASAARRVAQAREALLANTRRQLVLRLRVSREEIEGIVQMIQSRLDVSLHRLLKE
jgi:RNA polymerase sigma-70 factor (ECF subfamily)